MDEATAFLPLGATVRLDNSDLVNPALIVEKGIHRAILPIDTNILIVGKTSVMLPGIVVQIPRSGKIFVPQKAVVLLKEAGW